MRTLCCIAVAMCAVASDAASIEHEEVAVTPADPNETAEVLAVVDEMFRALEVKDVATWRRLMHPSGSWFIQSSDDSGNYRLTVDTSKNRIEGLAHMDAGIVDRYWAPEVRIAGPIATFWAKFEAEDKNGQKIACGVDAFQLIKENGAWRITNIMFTEEKCS